MTGALHPRGTIVPKFAATGMRHQGVMVLVGRNPRTGEPVIWFPKTGRSWTIRWPELIDQAIAAGLTSDPTTLQEPEEVSP